METAVEKMRDYAGWPTGSKEHLQLRDFEVTFYECVKDHVKAEHQGMTSSSDRLEEAFVPLVGPIFLLLGLICTSAGVHVLGMIYTDFQ